MTTKKGGLGRGMGILVGEANAETAGMNSDSESTIPISNIEPNKNQPRKNFDEKELEELADSIKQNGILQPLLVRPKGDGYEIVAGERRYQAAKLAGLSEVPVVIRDIDDDEVFQLALIENLQRSDLSPLEEARGYRQLLDEKGMTQDELAKTLSKSRSSITNTLRLLDLPQEVQDLLEEGKITAGHARAILAVPSEEGRIRLAEKVAEEHLSVRQTESLAPMFSVKDDEVDEKPKREPQPQSYRRAARQLRLALDTDVKVRTVRGKHKIEIEFTSEEQLAHIVSVIAGMEAEDEA